MDYIDKLNEHIKKYGRDKKVERFEKRIIKSKNALKIYFTLIG